jgi:hypothetical protein
LNLRLRYVIYGHRTIAGNGRLVDISSTGLLFRSDHKMVRGDLIEAVIDWPLTTPDGNPLLLMVGGYVLRTKALSAAVLLEKKDIVQEHALESHGSAGWKRKYERIRPVLLLLDDDALSLSIASVLGGYRFPVYRADRADIRSILSSGFPPLRLIITDRLEPFADIPIDIPLVYCGKELESPVRDRLNVPRFVSMRHPVLPEELRATIASVLVLEGYRQRSSGNAESS